MAADDIDITLYERCDHCAEAAKPICGGQCNPVLCEFSGSSPERDRLGAYYSSIGCNWPSTDQDEVDALTLEARPEFDDPNVIPSDPDPP